MQASSTPVAPTLPQAAPPPPTAANPPAVARTARWRRRRGRLAIVAVVIAAVIISKRRSGPSGDGGDGFDKVLFPAAPGWDALENPTCETPGESNRGSTIRLA